jgi:hypothetical protein
MTHLLAAVSRDEGGRGIALVDDRGRLLAGSGVPREMWAATRLAQGRGVESGPGPGYVSRTILSPEGTLILAAIGVGRGLSGMGRAAEGVARILGQTPPT